LFKPKRLLKITPLFLVFAVLVALSGKLVELVLCLVALSVHEIGHILVAKKLGYPVKRVVLSPFGAAIGLDGMSDKDEFLIALSGPFANLIFGVLCLFLRCIITFLAGQFNALAVFNLALCVFNLLPFYPLDGARIVLSFSKKRLAMLSRLKRAGFVASAVFGALCIISIFFNFNLSLGLMSLFLLFGAVTSEKKEYFSQLVKLTKRRKKSQKVAV